MSTALSSDQVEFALESLPGWNHSDHAISKEFVFGSFPEALSFIVRIGFSAEQMNHHPELFNVYNRVRVTLTTHDAGNQVTQKDLDLAGKIEGFNWAH